MPPVLVHDKFQLNIGFGSKQLLALNKLWGRAPQRAGAMLEGIGPG
jgi:hypothetical protein